MESAEAVVEAADPASPTSPGADESLETVPEGAGGYDAAKDMADASDESAAGRLAQLQAQVEAQACVRPGALRALLCTLAAPRALVHFEGLLRAG